MMSVKCGKSNIRISQIRQTMGLAVLVMSFASQAFAAMTTLKQVQVSNGSQIDLLFDGKVGKSQARTEFFNDVIQISLNDVAVYPAKISSINGGPLVKIFAYQYAPKLVRCRLTVKGKAEDFKDRLQISTNGKVLSLRLSDAAASTVAAQASTSTKTDKITLQSTHPVKASERDEASKASETAKAEKPREIEVAKADASKSEAAQNALLEKVMKSAPAKPVAVTTEAKEDKASAADEDSSSSKKRKTDKLGLAGAKPLPSPMGVMAKLLGVIGLFGAMAFGAKKFLHGKVGGADRQIHARIAREAVGGKAFSNASGSGLMSALGGLAKSAAAGLGKKEKMIEVLSNHHLGPKKSIAVVRVMGKTLVLGITNESINLISQVQEGEDEADVDLEGLFGDGMQASDRELTNSHVTRAARQAAAQSHSGAQAYAQAQAQTSRPLPGNGAGATGAGPSIFSQMVQQEAKKPNNTNVRSQIRSRLEGLKQL